MCRVRARIPRPHAWFVQVSYRPEKNCYQENRRKGSNLPTTLWLHGSAFRHHKQRCVIRRSSELYFSKYWLHVAGLRTQTWTRTKKSSVGLPNSNSNNKFSELQYELDKNCSSSLKWNSRIKNCRYENNIFCWSCHVPWDCNVLLYAVATKKNNMSTKKSAQVKKQLCIFVSQKSNLTTLIYFWTKTRKN